MFIQLLNRAQPNAPAQFLGWAYEDTGNTCIEITPRCTCDTVIIVLRSGLHLTQKQVWLLSFSLLVILRRPRSRYMDTGSELLVHVCMYTIRVYHFRFFFSRVFFQHTIPPPVDLHTRNVRFKYTHVRFTIERCIILFYIIVSRRHSFTPYNTLPGVDMVPRNRCFNVWGMATRWNNI